jgi:hypothetical protein
MKSKSMPGHIIEITLKGVAVILCIIPAFLIQVIRVIIIAIVKGFPSLTDELTNEVDGFFEKSNKPLQPEVDIVPIVHTGVQAILDKERSVHIAHALYSEKDIEADIDALVKQIKGIE